MSGVNGLRSLRSGGGVTSRSMFSINWTWPASCDKMTRHVVVNTSAHELGLFEQFISVFERQTNSNSVYGLVVLNVKHHLY